MSILVLFSWYTATTSMMGMASAFVVAPPSSRCSSVTTGTATTSNNNTPSSSPSSTSTTLLRLGFLDGIFGSKETVEASHILLKGPNAAKQCEQLKMDIYKKAIGRGNPADGVEPEKLMAAVRFYYLTIVGFYILYCFVQVFRTSNE